MSMKKALYPGSFNPITKGHMSIISQASCIFDEIIISVLKNTNKPNEMFSIEENVELIKEIYKDNRKIKVITSKGASVDVAIENNCNMMIRGLRNLSDYNYEMELANINKDISDGKVNTVCFFSDIKYQFTSSTSVKEIFRLGKDISKYTDDLVINKMKQKLNK